MTDTIKTSISLSKLAALVRMDVPAQMRNCTNPWGEFKGQYVAPSTQKSAMTNTKTKWVIRCEPGTGQLEGYNVPAFIEAELNIPNAVTGQNVEHGTSVFASGVSSLELQRIWLANCGLPREQLDLLTVDDVRLNGVTITYLMHFSTRSQAEELVEAIGITGRILNDDCNVHLSSNDTVYIPERDYKVTAYIKSDFSHCAWIDGTTKTQMTEAAAYIVRIESVLSLPFLRARNLIPLVRWQDAYSTGLYERIFNDTVRASLRLTGGILRHKAPREEVMAKLTPTEAKVLRGYLATPPLEPRKSKSVQDSVNPSKRFHELRKSILQQTRIDINIPWKKHSKLRCFELADSLVYPGDYSPSEDRAALSFCEANWPKIREDMQLAYERALAVAEARNASKVARVMGAIV
ncbi:hypothetical protein [Duganella sp. P38]|uniref:hypothetical protein n=1 Tax=Duganella sp. P38 TaxID=3423949 RepID=UPI003D7A525F